MKRDKALFVQKFISVLDDYHFGIFIAYLKQNNAALPIKLCKAIRKKLPALHTIDQLYKEVYGSNGLKKGTLHQLSLHSIKLSSVLAINYPNYLSHNISRIEQLVNTGEQATELAERVIAVSYKTGDFETCMKACFFLIRHGSLIKIDVSETVALYEEVKVNLHILHRLQAYTVKPPETGEAMQAALEDAQATINHPHPAISIFSTYTYLKLRYKLNLGSFEEEDIATLIHQFEKEYAAHAYVCFPFMLDIKGDIGFFKLNSTYTVQQSELQSKGYTALSGHYDSVLYTKVYAVNIQITLITTQLTMLLTKYHHQIFKANYNTIVSSEDKALMQALLQKCRELIDNKFIRDDDYRKLLVCQSALKILCGGKSLKEGIEELESFLITYQQINLKTTTGTIYFFLIIAYFSLRKYDVCVQLYRRYRKVSAGKGIYQGNHMKILAFYYFAQWQLHGSAQYISKVKELLVQYIITPQAIAELAAYCNMPVLDAGLPSD